MLTACLSAQGLTIGSGSTFSLGGATLSLPNNYNDSGTFVSGTGTVVFYGATGNQTISSVSVDTFQNLTVNKAAGNVVLNKNIAMKGNLTVTLGDLDMNNDTIKMGTAALLSETAGNTVKGAGKILGPLTIGAPSALNPFGLGATLTSSVSLGASVIGRGHVTQHGIGADSSIWRLFDIYPSTNSGLNATLVFRYDASELNGMSETGLCLYRSTDTGVTWTKMNGTVDTAANTVTLNGIDGFSRWTLSSDFAVAVREPPAVAAQAGVPRVFAFSQNYPNPFSRTTMLRFTLKDDGLVTLKVYDMAGREAATLVNSELKAGVLHSASFDASELASGTYVCRLNAGNRSLVRKIKLVK